MAVAAAPAKKVKEGKEKTTTPAAHPKVADMVVAAITALKNRGGSSNQAIKKHIAANYKVNIVKITPFVKRYLKKAVADGNLVQTKGTGASGSFKLSAAAKKPVDKPKKVKKPKAEKPKKVKTPKKTLSGVKKAAKPKKTKTPKKAVGTKPKAARKLISPKKAATKSAKQKVKKSPKKTKAVKK